MGLSDELKAEVQSVFRSLWTVRDGETVPEAPDIKLSNEGVKLNATVLYADIDGSTSMVDTLSKEFAAEVYKTYLLCASRIIKSEGGVITAYDGDRVMAVFIGDSKNTSAARCGLKIRAAVSEIINPSIKAQYSSSDFQLRQVVGIDTSELLVARTGVRGANDLVWVGPAANHAAKLCNVSEQPYSTLITEDVFDALNDSVKVSSGRSMWERRTWSGRIIYRSSWWWSVPNS